MKIEIPENLKADMPQTMWGRILSATPVVMAVIATMLAGLSSSEMSQAQYARSLAAQQQSKAGDQWSFFQAKRLRSALARNTLDIITAAGPTPPALADLPLPATIPARDGLTQLAEKIADARDRAAAFDDALAPVLQRVEQLPATRDGIAARAKFNAARYDAEAKLNQTIGVLYEEQVRQSNATAERHHERSQRFFYGMLAAQAGVIIATFAIAARKRNLLWTIAAAAGLIAVLFAVWVYLYV
jgi:hypothetical protein